MLVERADCFLATAAIFSIYLNYRGEAHHIGINVLFVILYQLQGCDSIKSFRIYALPTIIAGAGNWTLEVSIKAEHSNHWPTGHNLY